MRIYSSITGRRGKPSVRLARYARPPTDSSSLCFLSSAPNVTISIGRPALNRSAMRSQMRRWESRLKSSALSVMETCLRNSLSMKIEPTKTFSAFTSHGIPCSSVKSGTDSFLFSLRFFGFSSIGGGVGSSGGGSGVFSGMK